METLFTPQAGYARRAIGVLHYPRVEMHKKRRVASVHHERILASAQDPALLCSSYRDYFAVVY